MTVPVSIPRYPDDVTADWLAGVLDADVSDVEVTAVGTGQTGATYRVAVDYAANPGALPDTFVIKLPATDDAVRDRVVFGLPQRVRVLRLGGRPGAGADPSGLSLRHLRGRLELRTAAERSGTRDAGRSAGGLRRDAGPAGGDGHCRSARPHLGTAGMADLSRPPDEHRERRGEEGARRRRGHECRHHRREARCQAERH